MLILTSMREIDNPKLGKIDGLERSYANYYSTLGLTLLPVPNLGHSIVTLMEKVHFDGVLLTGGNSVSPQRYGSTSDMDDQSNERDTTEYAMLDYAIDRRIPVLGICRGTQLINVYFEGTLTDGLNTPEYKVKHVANDHEIIINDDELSKKLGESRQIVNSYHNQGIKASGLASSLRSFAIAEDGTIEGVYHPEHNLAGIMWHPERKSSSTRLDHLVINLFRQHDLYWSR